LQALVHFATEVGDQGICQRFLFFNRKAKALFPITSKLPASSVP
jgi:hypothetical protein